MRHSRGAHAHLCQNIACASRYSSALRFGDLMARALLISLPALALVACRTLYVPQPEGDDTGNGGVDTGPPPVDADEDGWSVEEDCDDANPDIHPGATEECDGIDQNCDGIADDDLLLSSWADEDADGYGAGEAEVACTIGEGRVDNDLDCNDADVAVNPSVEEICNGIDDDCDGEIEGGYATWYMDYDGDGYGDDDTAEWDCQQPLGSVDVGGDCDDGDEVIFPGADDPCENGIDEDCNGTDRSCLYSGHYDMAAGTAKIYAPGTYYAAGEYLAVGDPTGDGINDVLVTTFESDSGAGGGYLVPGPITGTASFDDVAYRFKSTSATPSLARSIDIGDLNGDGFDDVGMGAPDSNGKQYIFLGPITAGQAVSDADIVYTGVYDTEVGHGEAIADINGDGQADLLVGAYEDNQGGSDAGAVFIEYGPLTAGFFNLNTVKDGKLYGEAAASYAGRYVRAGKDVDGDGIGDMILASPYAKGGAPASGATYLVYGPVSGDFPLANADAKLMGQHPYEYAGEGQALGDVDGDGLCDIILGSYGSTYGYYYGTTYVVTQTVSGTFNLEYSDVIIQGTTYYQRAGIGLFAMDLDGDGADELLVGAPGDSTAATYAGATYLFQGPISGTLALTDAQATFTGEGASDSLGFSVAAGDVDGDDIPELFFGAPYDATGGYFGGALFVQASGL